MLLDAVRGVPRFMNSNLAIALLIASFAVTAYAVNARHHYNRGYDASGAKVAAEIAETNSRLEHLTALLASERIVAGIKRAQAVSDALAEVDRESATLAEVNRESAIHVGDVPKRSAPPPQKCQCGLSTSVIAKLNKIR